MKLILISIVFYAVFGGASCASRKHRWLLDMPLEDIVHHTLLQKAGIATVSLPDKTFDVDLYPFVQEFVDDARVRGVEIDGDTQDKLRGLRFVDKLSIPAEPGVMAACHRYYTAQATLGGSKMIAWLDIEVLKKESLTYADSGACERKILLREVIFHELFHCFLNKGHLPDGIEGIMSASFTKGNRRACTDWQGLVDEMFSPKYMSMIGDVSVPH